MSSSRATHFQAALLVAILALAQAVHADDGENAIGSISGEITYQRDSKRPWRYERYFVADRASRTLGEAVVALRGVRLRNVDRETKPKTSEMNQELFQFTRRRSQFAREIRSSF